MYLSTTLLAACAFFYCVFAKRMGTLPISGAMIFITLGFILGPQCLGVIELESAGTLVRVLADFTLALLLFADAASLKVSTLKSVKNLAIRMLLVGLPLTILLGFAAARWLFPEFGLWECAILATALAATDAALGKPVVTNTAVSERLRTTANVESGLNDGLCVPLLLLFIALANRPQMHETTELAMELFLSEIGLGLLFGVTITWLGTRLLTLAVARDWASPKWVPMSISILALLCFLVAQDLHGSGYIAAFVGGVTFTLLNHKQVHDLVNDTEESGEILGMLTWILFGVLAYHTVSHQPAAEDWIYAILSLTVIRVLPAMLVLSGTGLNWTSKFFLAWFGPRGLASVVFAFIIINSQVPQAEKIAAIISCTILLSVVLHGVSALPFIKKFSKALNG